VQRKEDEYNSKLESQLRFPQSCLTPAGREIASYVESINQMAKQSPVKKYTREEDREFQFFMQSETNQDFLLKVQDFKDAYLNYGQHLSEEQYC